MGNADLENLAWLVGEIPSVDRSFQEKAKRYQASLTKPLGALGELESIAIRFAGFQKKLNPQLNKILVRVFAADHGVCAQNVSAFPQAVTVQMIQNFVDGGAAISVLAKHLGADFSVVNMGTANPLLNSAGLMDYEIAKGTQDFSLGPAMQESHLTKALTAGRSSVSECELYIGGEMGIGNTTSASAIYCALLNIPANRTVGPGTGLDLLGQKRKCEVVERGLKVNAANITSPLGVLRSLGGFEIAALVGSYIAAAQKGIPILIDGFITTAAALLAVKINPTVREWMMFSHRSAEPAHELALQELDAKPLLDLGMRLGEGSGAAVCVDLLKTALRLHNEMATFEQAGVEKS